MIYFLLGVCLAFCSVLLVMVVRKRRGEEWEIQEIREYRCAGVIAVDAPGEEQSVIVDLSRFNDLGIIGYTMIGWLEGEEERVRWIQDGIVKKITYTDGTVIWVCEER